MFTYLKNVNVRQLLKVYNNQMFKSSRGIDFRSENKSMDGPYGSISHDRLFTQSSCI